MVNVVLCSGLLLATVWLFSMGSIGMCLWVAIVALWIVVTTEQP
jgi:hypothetical protein